MNQADSSCIKELNTNQLQDSATLEKCGKKSNATSATGAIIEKTYSFNGFLDFCKSNVAELAISAIFLIIASVSYTHLPSPRD